jgi:hypothetical protein
MSMAVFRSSAELLGAAGRLLGRGTVYVHLPRGVDRQQDASGTMSLRSWYPAAETPALLHLPDGRDIVIRVSRDALSDCSRSRVLRFSTTWPGA